jgi:hypothetical protein
MTIYRNILRQSLKITWRHKYLWFFGLFAALLGSGGEMDLLFRGFNADPEDGIFAGIKSFTETGIFNIQSFINIKNLIISQPYAFSVLIFVLILMLIIAIFLVWLATVSQIAVVNNSARIIAERETDFKSGLDEGMKKFWPVFSLNIISRIVVYLIIILISSSLLLAPIGRIMANVFYFSSFVVLIPATLIFLLIIKYAISYAVIKGENFKKAILSSWILFKLNWIASIEIAFLLFFINILFGLAIVMFLGILAVPLLLIGYLSQNFFPVIGFWGVAGFGLLLFTVIIVLAGSMMTVFQISSWTGIFVELIGRGAPSKLMRVVAGWNEKK